MTERGDRRPRLLAYLFLVQGVVSLATGAIAIGFLMVGPAAQRPLAVVWSVVAIGTGCSMLLVAGGLIRLSRSR